MEVDVCFNRFSVVLQQYLCFKTVKQELYSLNHPYVYLPTAQRSAHELPMVEKQDMDSCSVLGGQQMILTGQNFSADSKVIFTEKTHGE